jgi:hypothetical protein
MTFISLQPVFCVYAQWGRCDGGGNAKQSISLEIFSTIDTDLIGSSLLSLTLVKSRTPVINTLN